MNFFLVGLESPPVQKLYNMDILHWVLHKNFPYTRVLISHLFNFASEQPNTPCCHLPIKPPSHTPISPHTYNKPPFKKKIAFNPKKLPEHNQTYHKFPETLNQPREKYAKHPIIAYGISQLLLNIFSLSLSPSLPLNHRHVAFFSLALQWTCARIEPSRNSNADHARLLFIIFSRVEWISNFQQLTFKNFHNIISNIRLFLKNWRVGFIKKNKL